MGFSKVEEWGEGQGLQSHFDGLQPVRVPSGGNGYTPGFPEPGSNPENSPNRTTEPLERINIRKKSGQIPRFESLWL